LEATFDARLQKERRLEGFKSHCEKAKRNTRPKITGALNSIRGKVIRPFFSSIRAKIEPTADGQQCFCLGFVNGRFVLRPCDPQGLSNSHSARGW